MSHQLGYKRINVKVACNYLITYGPVSVAIVVEVCTEMDFSPIPIRPTSMPSHSDRHLDPSPPMPALLSIPTSPCKIFLCHYNMQGHYQKVTK